MSCTINPRRATMKAMIASGMLKVARFLLAPEICVGSDFFAGVATGAGVGGGTVGIATMGGGSEVSLAVGSGVATGSGVGGAVAARTGLGGKLSLGSFSNEAEAASSSPPVGGLVFIYFFKYYNAVSMKEGN